MIPAEPESPWQLNSQPNPDQRARPKSCARRHGVGHSGWVDRGRALAQRTVNVSVTSGDLVSAAAQAPTSGDDTEACLFTQAKTVSNTQTQNGSTPKLKMGTKDSKLAFNKVPIKKIYFGSFETQPKYGYPLS